MTTRLTTEARRLAFKSKVNPNNGSIHKAESPGTTSLVKQAQASQRTLKKNHSLSTVSPLKVGGLSADILTTISRLEEVIESEEREGAESLTTGAQGSETNSSSGATDGFYGHASSNADPLFPGVDTPIPAPVITLVGPVEQKSPSNGFSTPEQRAKQEGKNSAPPSPRLVPGGVANTRTHAQEQTQTGRHLERDCSLIPTSLGGETVFIGKKSARSTPPKPNKTKASEPTDDARLSPMERLKVVQRFSTPFSQESESTVAKELGMYRRHGNGTELREQFEAIKTQAKKFETLLNQSQTLKLQVSPMPPKGRLFGLFSKSHPKTVAVAQSQRGIDAVNGANLKPSAAAIIDQVDALANAFKEHSLDNHELLRVKSQLIAAFEEGFV